MFSKCRLVTCLLVLSLISVGCNQTTPPASSGVAGSGSATAGPTEFAAKSSNGDELALVLAAYSAYCDGFGKGPDSWETLLDFARKSKTFDMGPLERAQQRGVQITWGADMGRLPNGASGTVFAQGGGGPTLMFDGSAK